MSRRKMHADEVDTDVGLVGRLLAGQFPQWAGLPIDIPEPLRKGKPAEGYPWPWSVYRWLDGENPAVDRIADAGSLAAELAQFVAALHRIDPTGGPPAGRGVPPGGARRSDPFRDRRPARNGRHRRGGRGVGRGPADPHMAGRARVGPRGPVTREPAGRRR